MSDDEEAIGTGETRAVGHAFASSDSFDPLSSCSMCGCELSRDGFKSCLKIESRIDAVLKSLESK